MARKYYWLKLNEDFFRQKEIKKLRKIAGGDTYTIIYQKMLLLSLKNEGKLYFDGVEDDFAEEIALEIDEDVENVKVTILFLIKNQLVKEISEDEIFMSIIPNLIGKESTSAERMRKHREKKKQLELENKQQIKSPAKTSTERSQIYRAKKKCYEKQYIPYIEDYQNAKRYNGNYYIVFERDNYKCAICGSIDNLCMHHIDGYNELDYKSSLKEKLLTLCRKCHSNLNENNNFIPSEILQSIGYYESCNEFCDVTVTSTSYTDTDTDIETDLNTDIQQHEKSNENVVVVKNLIESFKKKYKGELDPKLLNNLIKEKGIDIVKKCIDIFGDYVSSAKEVEKVFYKFCKTWGTEEQFKKNTGYKNYNNNKPIQSTNYEQREYDDDFFDNLYDNIDYIK